MDQRWDEACGERTRGLTHIRSMRTGRCVYCGCNPSADWPDVRGMKPPFESPDHRARTLRS